MGTKKMKMIMGLLLTLTLLTLAACGGTEDGAAEAEGKDGVYTIKAAAVTNETNIVTSFVQNFKEIVEEKSDGKIKVDLFLNGSVASSQEEEVEQVKEGSIQLIQMTSFLGSQIAGVDGFNIYDMPFLFEDRDQLYGYIDGPMGEEINTEFEEKNGLKVLGTYDIGAMSIANTSKKIQKPEDLKGLAIRTPQSTLFLDSITAMGGTPTPLTFAEVYTSLQQGTLDGILTTLPLVYDSQFFEITEHVTLTNQNIIPQSFIMNEEFFASLPEDLQKIVEESAQEATLNARESIVTKEVDTVEKLEGEGVEVYELSSEEFNNFRESVQSMIEKDIELVGEDFYKRSLETLE